MKVLKDVYMLNVMEPDIEPIECLGNKDSMKQE